MLMFIEEQVLTIGAHLLVRMVLFLLILMLWNNEILISRRCFLAHIEESNIRKLKVCTENSQ